MENPIQNQGNNFLNWLNRSLTVKMAVIGLLILVLLIPLAYVQSLIEERADRQKEVITEINDKWGNEYTISGVILKVPYTATTVVNYTDPESKEIKTRTESVLKYAYFLPDEFDGRSNLEVKPLQRSIYKSAVYEGNLKVKGKLGHPNFKTEDINNEKIHWEKASVLIQTTNLKGIKNKLVVEVGGKKFALSPKYSSNQTSHAIHSLESEQFNFNDLTSNVFQFELEFNGSERFQIIPIAKQTLLNIKSNWTSPSFSGEFLPKNEAEKVTDNGFDANWNILYYNRPFAQQFFGSLPDLSEYAFGVDLLVPIDEYKKSERSAKYGYLVIVFTFLFFFLIQATAKINIHPFQYLLVGLALVMFYTLLISISEHSNFLKAYIISSASVIGLIGVYSFWVMKQAKFALVLSTSLAALYAFIYVIIQMENYALLVGSIGLFIILAIVMYVSRKIEWK